jgi:hypothetical protein
MLGQHIGKLVGNAGKPKRADSRDESHCQPASVEVGVFVNLKKVHFK